MQIVLWGLALALAGFFGLMAIVRLSSDDPAAWHVDPLSAESSGKPNEYWILPDGVDAPREGKIARIYPVPAPDLAEAFDAVALSEPRTTRLAGAPAEGWTTYVQRSRLFGFPDYISVRVIEVENGDGAMAAIYSRSRYGHSDLGVNAKRIRRWQSAVQTRLGIEEP